MTAVCKITNGLDHVSLVGEAFYIDSWQPAGVPFKDDGHWQDSAFGEGRRLSQYAIGNIVETITISQTSISQDTALRQINKLSSMLLSAAEYSVKPKHGRRPLYMEVKATAESNTRYAHIYAGHVGDYGNPFSQPFLQPNCRAAVQGVSVIIERGPWLEAPPGTDVCQAASPTGNRIGDTTINKYDYANLVLADAPSLISWFPFAMYKLNETSGTTAVNYSIYGTALDGVHDATNTLADLVFWNNTDPTAFIPITTGNVDIYSADFNAHFDGDEGSMIAWINTAGPMWTGGNDAFFVNLQSASSYIRIYHPATPDNSITWEYNVGGSINTHNDTGFDETGKLWISVGATWSKASGVIKFFLNGSLVYADAIAESAWSGDLVSTTTCIGAETNSGTSAAVSDMAYVAFWNKELTQEDMAMIGIESGNRVSGIDFNLFDCEEIVAYVSNKRNMAALTHIYHHDASLATFSSNLLNSTPPYAILPDPIAVGDSVYFGVQQTSDSGRPGGPFNSLVFDITTEASASTYTTTWQYWNGSAWTSITSNLADHTASQLTPGAFSIGGINSVHWDQPGDWAENAINSITAHWVRLVVSNVSGTWTQPVVSDYPYTIIRNTLEIPAQTVGGSMPALGRIVWHNDTLSEVSRVVIGMKSDELAPGFESYLNISDEQNNGFVQVVPIHADTSFQDNPTAATGRVLDLTESAGVSAMTDIFRITIFNILSGSYLGSFKVFMIYLANASALPAEVEFGYRLNAPGSSNDYTIVSGGQYVGTANHTVHEIGEISIRPNTFYNDTIGNVEFVWRSEITSGMGVDFYALVLIPTDEWFGDFDGAPVSQTIGASYLSVDGTRYTGKALSADARAEGSNALVGTMLQSHNGPPVILHNRDSKFHFFFMEEDYRAKATHSGRVQVFRNRRYHYGRGDE